MSFPAARATFQRRRVLKVRWKTVRTSERVCILYVQWRILSRLALHQCRTCGSGEHDRRRCVELRLERTLRRGAVGVVRAPCVIHGSTELIQTRSARVGVTYGGCATWPNSQSRGATSHIATFRSCIPLSSPICPAPTRWLYQEWCLSGTTHCAV